MVCCSQASAHVAKPCQPDVHVRVAVANTPPACAASSLTLVMQWSAPQHKAAWTVDGAVCLPPLAASSSVCCCSPPDVALLPLLPVGLGSCILRCLAALVPFLDALLPSRCGPSLCSLWAGDVCSGLSGSGPFLCISAQQEGTSDCLVELSAVIYCPQMTLRTATRKFVYVQEYHLTSLVRICRHQLPGHSLLWVSIASDYQWHAFQAAPMCSRVGGIPRQTPADRPPSFPYDTAKKCKLYALLHLAFR